MNKMVVVCLFVVVVVWGEKEKSSRTVEDCGRDFSTSCDSISAIEASIGR